MLQGRSFKNILEEKLNAQSFPSQNASVRLDNSPEHLAFLLGKMHKLDVSPSAEQRAQKAYPAKPRPVRPAHNFSSQQLEAYLFVLKWAGELADNFSAQELKTAFRKAAIRLHPDQGGCTTLFLKLRGFHKTLESLLNPSV